MKVIIGARHFERAKQQAHKIRDKLLDDSTFGSLESIFTKSSFLNVWADILGYQDWGSFRAMSMFAHQDNQADTIITPDRIEYLSDRLSQKCFFQPDQTYLFTQILLDVAYEHEIALFDDDVIRHYSLVIGSQEAPIMLELGPSPYLSHLLEYFFQNYSMCADKRHIENEFLAFVKSLRKKALLSKKNDIKNASLDIYPKSGCIARELIADALEQGWIESYTNYAYREKLTYYRLSQRAIKWIVERETDNYSEAWLTWNVEVDKLLSALPYERRGESKFARLKGYRDKKTPGEYIENVIFIPVDDPEKSWANHSRRVQVKHKIQFDISHYQDNQEPIFHITPRMLLSYEELSSLDINDLQVTIYVEFRENDKLIDEVLIEPGELSIVQPYPNKRHVRADNSIGEMGRYVMLPAGTDTVVCRYTWEDLGKGKTVTHIVTHPLVMMKGNSLFSAYHPVNFDRTLHERYSYPLSFFCLSAVCSSASTVKEIEEIPRFANQVYKYHRKEQTVSIDEELPIVAGGLHFYHH